MKRILIATDFSREAYCALFYATRLFQEKDNKFFIVNFYGEKTQTSIYSTVNEEAFIHNSEIKQNSELACYETLHHIVRDSGLSGSQFEVIASDQKFVPGLVKITKRLDVDMVVMGTKDHSGTIHSIAETNTTNIIDKALPVPLLIIPRELDFTAPAHIGFASELIYDFNLENLGLLKKIAQNFNSQITVIHDGEETQMSQRQWKNYNLFKSFFDDIPVELKFCSTHIEVSRTVACFVKNHNIDLLSMSYFKHSAIGKLFREPVVEKIDRHLSYPFLILPDKA